MTNLFTIHNDTVIIDKLAVAKIQGDITINGNTKSFGSFNIVGDLVSRNIVADTIKVKTIISDTTEFGNWNEQTVDALNGKGISWTCDTGTLKLVYRTDNRIWTNGNFDIPSESSYRIDNVPVLTINTLGSSITKSNLRQVGALTALSVIGEASFGGFMFVNNSSNRVGIGTSEPNASVSIMDNNVEIIIGSPSTNVAAIGTFTSHNLALVTNNIPRLVVKNSGEVHIGDQESKSGVLRVHGSLYVNSLITDTRVERTSSLEFNASREDGVYNKGLVWNTPSESKKLLLMSNPDRLYSTESIEIAPGKSLFINGSSVLSSTAIGNTVTGSKLTSVGNLLELTVDGTTTLNGSLAANLINLKDSTNQLDITPQGITANTSILITAGNTEVFYADSNEVTIGNKQTVKVAKLSIGVTDPDPTVDLAVNGNVSFNNKKFVTGSNIPTSGSFMIGDICWSQNPTLTGYVGWVCVQDGSPGIWRTFGLLGA